MLLPPSIYVETESQNSMGAAICQERFADKPGPASISHRTVNPIGLREVVPLPQAKHRLGRNRLTALRRRVYFSSTIQRSPS